MKRQDAIKSIGDEILKDGLVEALFLKGSIARGEDDKYSDVDMYAVVSSENLDVFLSKRIQYMEKYMPLIYWSEANFVGPQIVGVFENALHFDLYTVNPDSIPQTDDIKIIFDKGGLLDSYKKAPLGISPETIIDILNEFTFTLLEFEAAYAREDYVWAVTLFHFQLSKASFITRFIHDADNSKLGLKRIHKVIPDELYKEYIDIFENARPSKILIAMKKLVLLMDGLIHQLPDDMQNKMNMKFFNLMKEKLDALWTTS